MTDRAAVGRRKAKAKKKTQRIPPFAPSNRCADCINLTRRVAMLEDRMAVRDRINRQGGHPSCGYAQGADLPRGLPGQSPGTGHGHSQHDGGDMDRTTVGRRNQQAGRAEQDACARLLALAGFVVYRVGDAGAAKGRSGYRGAMMSPGVPDLFAVHKGASTALWWEVKAGMARLTTEQQEFAAAISETFDVWCGFGDRVKLRETLIEWGFLRGTADGVTIDKLYPDVGRVVTARRRPATKRRAR